jgi:uncharacterized protein YcbK (DUF882 family)
MIMKTVKKQSHIHKISRRRFLVCSAQAAVGLLIVPPKNCWAMGDRKYPLSLFHTHTEECLKIIHTPGCCSSSVQNKIKMFLRDFRTGDIHPIDPALLDILCKIQSVTGSQGTIEIISGYRSPQTNNILSHTTHGVAKKSLHMKGQAVDVRITDLPTLQLHNTAASLRTGGVGYYAKSDFVHLDTGPFRTW